MITLPIGSQVTKDPEAVTLYGIDWTSFLDGLTIAGSDWEITGPDNALTQDQSAIPTTTSTRVRLSGGTVGATYTVENKITLSGSPSQIEPRSFKVFIQEL